MLFVLAWLVAICVFVDLLFACFGWVWFDCLCLCLCIKSLWLVVGFAGWVAFDWLFSFCYFGSG